LTGDCKKWTPYENTNVDNGQRNDASNLADCQDACENNDQCTGLDWDPSAAQNQRCWLHGSWSRGWNNGSASGVTHYELDRGCMGKYSVHVGRRTAQPM